MHLLRLRALRYHCEKNKLSEVPALIASLNKQREGVEQRIQLWDENIERIRLLYNKFTSETHAPELEELIAIVQLSSDNLKKTSHGYSATLYVLETTNEFIKSNLAERDEKIRQINRETDEKIRQINRDFETGIEKLKNK
jgi:vacuolar-type H+-ATPase subunit I/STV1